MIFVNKCTLFTARRREDSLLKSKVDIKPSQAGGEGFYVGIGVAAGSASTDPIPPSLTFLTLM